MSNKVKSFKIDNSSIELFLVNKLSRYKKIAYFTNNENYQTKLKTNLLRIDPKLNIIVFPSIDCDFFSNLSPTPANKAKRISALQNLTFLDSKKTIFLSSLKALVTKTIESNLIENYNFTLTSNTSLNYEQILDFIDKAGYEKVDFVINKGEYSTRGEVLDIFSPIHQYPLRVLFDFDKVESLHFFSTDDQLSIKPTIKYSLCLSSEFQFNKDNIECFRTLFRKLKLTNKDDYYKSISENNILPASEQFFPILNKNFDSILKYLNGFNFVFNEDYENEISSILNETIESKTEFIKLNKMGSNFFLNINDLNLTIKNRFELISSDIINPDDEKSLVFSSKVQFKNNKTLNQNLIINLIKSKKKIIFCSISKINERKISNIVNSLDLSLKKITSFDANLIWNSDYNVFIFKYEIDSSFQCNFNDSMKFLFISDQEFCGKISKKAVSSSIKEENLIDHYSNLKVGDFIVHNDHGIGRYNGLKSRCINDSVNEFIELIYHGNDKLLIPVENLDLISKYGQSEIKVNLDKLGLQNWQHRKAIVKKRIKDIAKTLIKTAAERRLQKGDILVAKNFEYEKFSSEFEFTETSDQIKSIHQIENDLLSGRPMDRLICGDVGFGKTEIAMRASFIAVSAGYQVAIICPKLLLVNQHLKNFKMRFKNFSYKIRKITRIETLSEKKIIKNDVENGSIDILIGTHAILSGDISFKKLGLIIIDEEQSFGVEQKEKLKKLKPNSHILTLSATPIPRTLQSSIFQLKNISLIKTPPLSRLNIKTYLMLKDKTQIKQIIKKELDRDGQVFYVCPRISDLDQVEKNLKSLFPKLEYDIIHGRLSNKNIEESYERFFKKKSKLLISTAMIESGLDISNVNTIIIEKPELFGLSQLYQLRGRVGRSSRQAFAYLIIDNFKGINENSLKKLKIISKINSLGSGFSIASSDLDLRGGGNIVGSEQSGHIREVGLELYYKMLKETVNELKSSKKIDNNWTPSINLGFSISIPDNYIEDLDMRLSLYRKISNISDIAELEHMLTNLKDRFGKVPISFKNLFHIIEIRIKAKKLFIKKIDYSNKGFVLEFKNDNMMDVEKIIKLVQKNSKILKLMPGSKLFFKNTYSKDIDKVQGLKNLLHAISK